MNWGQDIIGRHWVAIEKSWGIQLKQKYRQPLFFIGDYQAIIYDADNLSINNVKNARIYIIPTDIEDIAIYRIATTGSIIGLPMDLSDSMGYGHDGVSATLLKKYRPHGLIYKNSKKFKDTTASGAVGE